MKISNRILLAVLCLTSLPSWAMKEYYSPSRSIRAHGMGGAFYGWSNDEYALFYNPAGLSLYSGNGEGGLRVNGSVGSKSLSAISTLTKMGDDNIQTIVDKLTEYQGTPLFARAGLLPYYFKKHFAVGLLLADTKIDFALLGKELNSNAEVSVFTDSGLYVAYARPLFDPNLHIGATVKGYYRAGGTKSYSLADIAKKASNSIDPKDIGGAGGGIDADLGATYILPKLPIGIEHRVSLVFSNLVAANPSIGKTGANPPKMSRMGSLGWYSVFPGVWKIDNFHLLIDFAEFNLGGETDSERGARTGSVWKHVNIGTEIPIGIMSLRAGLSQGNLSAGLGFNFKIARLDFATYGEELGYLPGKLTSRRYEVSLMLGWASSPTPPVTAIGFSEDVKKIEEIPETKAKEKKDDPAPVPTQPRKPNESDESKVDSPQPE